MHDVVCEDAQKQLARTSLNLISLIIWQGKSERSDWFFLTRDFAIQTVSTETVISCVLFGFDSRQT